VIRVTHNISDMILALKGSLHTVLPLVDERPVRVDLSGGRAGHAEAGAAGPARLVDEWPVPRWLPG